MKDYTSKFDNLIIHINLHDKGDEIKTKCKTPTEQMCTLLSAFNFTIKNIKYSKFIII